MTMLIKIDPQLLEGLYGVERQREHSRLYSASYRLTDQGREADSRYRGSEKRRLWQAAYDRTPESKSAAIEYNKSSEGKLRQVRHGSSLKGKLTYARYDQSTRGKARGALACSLRRDRSTDPDMFAARVEYMHFMQESCSDCGRLYSISFQIDHIIALCNGGTDDWDNLQPLCIECHRKKTVLDLEVYRV